MKENISKSDINRFCEVLQSLDVSAMPIANYPRQYLTHLLIHKQYFVEIYATVLNHVLLCSTQSRKKINLIDYGCGNGLLGLFAKFCGFGKVILIDVSSEFMVCARYLSTTLAISIDSFIEGTIDDFETKTMGTPDAIVGTDMIEHIYDLDLFFSTLKKLNSDIITVFTTASNNKNWFKRQSLIKIQKQDEWTGWQKDNSGHDYTSFRQLRRQIILNELPNITEIEVEHLVSGTRGLKKEDIITACKHFERSGEVPKPPHHPTNTCDPLTGSWTERLLSFNEYQQLYRTHFLQLTIYKGFYNATENTIKSYFLAIINKFILHSGKLGFHLSPHIILTGV